MFWLRGWQQNLLPPILLLLLLLRLTTTMMMITLPGLLIAILASEITIFPLKNINPTCSEQHPSCVMLNTRNLGSAPASSPACDFRTFEQFEKVDAQDKAGDWYQ
jgi:hypothetical protein